MSVFAIGLCFLFVLVHVNAAWAEIGAFRATRDKDTLAAYLLWISEDNEDNLSRVSFKVKGWWISVSAVKLSATALLSSMCFFLFRVCSLMVCRILEVEILSCKQRRHSLQEMWCFASPSDW